MRAYVGRYLPRTTFYACAGGYRTEVDFFFLDGRPAGTAAVSGVRNEENDTFVTLQWIGDPPEGMEKELMFRKHWPTAKERVVRDRKLLLFFLVVLFLAFLPYFV